MVGVRDRGSIFSWHATGTGAGPDLAFVLVAPRCGCESLGGLWGPKDDPVLDEPADRIYNEGLYLLNIKKDTKGAAKRLRRSTGSTLIPVGAQVADHVGLRLL
jgi:hypothetical protein